MSVTRAACLGLALSLTAAPALAGPKLLPIQEWFMNRGGTGCVTPVAPAGKNTGAPNDVSPDDCRGVYPLPGTGASTVNTLPLEQRPRQEVRKPDAVPGVPLIVQ